MLFLQSKCETSKGRKRIHNEQTDVENEEDKESVFKRKRNDRAEVRINSCYCVLYQSFAELLVLVFVIVCQNSFHNSSVRFVAQTFGLLPTQIVAINNAFFSMVKNVGD